MTTQVKHVVFDIGKVLLHYDPELAYLEAIPDPTERRWFLDNICTGEWNIEQDRGRSWQDAEALLIEAHPEHTDNIRMFRRNWNLMVPHSYDDSVAILRGLIAQGHDVTMLTNFASDTLREARGRFPFLNESRGITVSGDIRTLKPNREIYEHHVTSFNLDPMATLFIDDSPANVEGAKAAGWQAVHFTSAPKLADDLRGYGLSF